MLRLKNLIIAPLLLCTLSFAISPEVIDRGDHPNIDLNTLQLIRRAGYRAEAHEVLTDDGYLLTIHRVPGKPGAPVIFLQHGILGSSADWLICGRKNSLVYLLADMGYDVWLGNCRGNTYSRGHVSLSISDSKYWNFSWHEVGVYDLPAMITYTVNFTGNPLKAFIGYSMGTTSFYVMCSERPEMTQLIKSSYSLAPIAFLKHAQGLLKYIAPLTTINNIKLLFYLLGDGEFLPQNAFIKFFANYFCSANILEKKICTNLLFSMTGFDNAQFNYTLLPMVLNHLPAGASSKMFIHYGQEIESGYFRQYDYGKTENMLKYNSVEPPLYNISRVTVPHTIVCASNDWLSNLVDTNKLINSLPVKPPVYKVPFSSFNHVDYLFAIDVFKLVYQPLIRMLGKPN